MELEAEIALPKKEANRLWLGILSHDMVVLKLLVSHPLACRAEFEPQATDALRSLRFLDGVPDLPQHPCGLPLPPDCTPMPASEILEDLGSQGSWEVFRTPHSMGAVQAFYWREAPAAGWEITSFQPYPGEHPLPFARVGLHKAGQGDGPGHPSPSAGTRRPRATARGSRCTGADAVAARTPLRRFGEPEDVVGAALFLASSASAYVNGAVITVDGGLLVSGPLV